MSNLTVTGNADFSFDNSFLLEDSSEGVRLLNVWRENHPGFKWSDRDASGCTVAERLLYLGNVSVLKYVINEGGPELLRTQDPEVNHFHTMIACLFMRGNHILVEKVEECTKILIEAEALDPTVGLDQYHAKLKTTMMTTWTRRMKLYAPNLTKLFLQAGAQWNGPPNDTVEEASKELLDWKKSRHLYLGGDFSQLPTDIICLIQGQIIIHSD
jgi:hypothetical protein